MKEVQPVAFNIAKPPKPKAPLVPKAKLPFIDESSDEDDANNSSAAQQTPVTTAPPTTEALISQSVAAAVAHAAAAAKAAAAAAAAGFAPPVQDKRQQIQSLVEQIHDVPMPPMPPISLPPVHDAPIAVCQSSHWSVDQSGHGTYTSANTSARNAVPGSDAKCTTSIWCTSCISAT